MTGLPSSRQSKQEHQIDVASRYAQLLEGVTLEQLGQAFPEDSWQHVLRSGWATEVSLFNVSSKYPAALNSSQLRGGRNKRRSVSRGRRSS